MVFQEKKTLSFVTKAKIFFNEKEKNSILVRNCALLCSCGGDIPPFKNNS